MASGSDHAQMSAVLDRWVAEVWHGGQLDRVSELVAPIYTRHDNAGTRQVTPEAYARDIAAMRARYPDLRFFEHDRAIAGDRLWVRWTSRGTDPRTGVVHTRAGMQVYRFEGGRLAETWNVAQDPGVWDEYEETN